MSILDTIGLLLGKADTRAVSEQVDSKRKTLVWRGIGDNGDATCRWGAICRHHIRGICGRAWRLLWLAVFGAVGGRTIWGFCQHGDSLGAAFSRRRSCRAAGDGGRPPLTLAGAPGSDHRAVGPATGSDLTGDPRRPGRAWDQCWAGEFVALSQGAEHHAKKRVFTPPSKIAST